MAYDESYIKHAKKNIYGASMKNFSSYTSKSSTEILHYASHPMGGHRMSRPHPTLSTPTLMLSQPQPPARTPTREPFSS